MSSGIYLIFASAKATINEGSSYMNLAITSSSNSLTFSGLGDVRTTMYGGGGCTAYRIATCTGECEVYARIHSFTTSKCDYHTHIFAIKLS